VKVPLAKIFIFCGLLPGLLKGEDALLAMGGAYEGVLSTF
jgi:NAD+--dinitrogen-reductase ADP-D-ribosyltransferase